MRVNRRYTVPFRRKREGKTNYAGRLALVKSKAPRLVLRRTSNHMIAQLVEFHPQGDKILARANSRELKSLNWPFRGNLPTAFLTGYLLAARAKKLDQDVPAVVDLGFQKAHGGSQLFAALRGVVEGGVEVKHDESILPRDDRVRGEHIATYATQAQGSQFAHLKSKADPADITKLFDETKKAIEAKN